MRNLSQAVSTLPPSVVLLEFPRSDGNPTRSNHPTNTTKRADAEGQVNFYRPVPIDEASSVKWRLALGTALAPGLNKPAGSYALKEWPEHYALYDHNKGSEANPRHDLYLIGSSTVNRFRSIPEFTPHAIWLMGPESDSCACKYCSGSKSQRPITQKLTASGIRLQSHASASPAPSTPRQPRTKPSTSASVLRPQREPRPKRRPNKPQPYAHAQPRERVVIESNKTKPAVEDRILDIRAVNQRDLFNPESKELVLLHRTQEIVWCILPKPIPSGSDKASDSIIYWPAIIKRGYQKIQTTIIREISPSEYDPNNPNFESRQLAHYEIELLGVSRTKNVEARMIVPFIAWKIPSSLSAALRALPQEYLHYEDAAKNHLFDPMPSQPRILDFKDAAAPFSVAAEIGDTASRMWALSDEYEFKYTVPAAQPAKPPPAKALPRPPRQHTLLSNSVSAPPASTPTYAGLSGVESEMTAERVQEVALNVLGVAPKPSTRYKQLRFQGLWWGSERVWVGDMVRLKPGRYHIAPNGSENIHAAAGPSPLAIMGLPNEVSGDDINKYGALTRGVLMKIEAIMIIERPSDVAVGETKKECRLSGSLYELVDDDWADNSKDVPMADSEPPEYVSMDLPRPPAMYKFRKIQKKGTETVLSLTLLSGRYYPGITTHPEILKLLTQLTCVTPPVELSEALSLVDGNLLFALESLAPGFFNSMDPTFFMQHREAMFEEARRKALERLRKGGGELNVINVDEDIMMIDV